MRRKVGRRRVVAGVLAAGVFGGLAGCVTTGLQAEAPGVENSAVFAGVSPDASWARGTVRATVTLQSGATTDREVRTLNVVSASGSTVSTASVAAGQTSATVYLPVGQRATLVAVNASDETVETLDVRVTGNSLP